LLLVSFQ